MPSLPYDIQFPESDFIYKNDYCDLYILSRRRVDALIHYTMSEDFLEDLTLIFGVPTDNFISLRMYPFDIVKLNPSIPFVDGHILVGNHDSNITALLFPNISSLYFYKLGQLYFEQKTFDYRDFNPFTKYELYLPFYGYVEIDYNKYWKKNIAIWYGMNYQTGSATIFLIEVESGRVIENYECQIGVDIPIGSTNYNQIMTNITSGALKNIFSVAIGGGISASASEDMIGYYSRRKKKGDAERVRNLKADSKSAFGSEISSVIEGLNIPTLSGSVMNGVSGYNGFYSPLKCHLKITRTKFLDPDNYNHNYGRPCMRTFKLNELKGYTKVSEVHIEGVPATDNEIEMIDAALKQGVLLPETVYELYPIRVTGNNITYSAPQYISSNETKTVTITVDENYSSQLEITGATYTTTTVGNVITITLTNPTSTVNINVETTMKQYTVTKNTMGCSITGVSTVQPNHMYIFTVIPSSHYSLPSNVIVTGAENYSYNSTNGYLSINNPTGNIVITALAIPEQFSITYNLTHVSAVGTPPNSIEYNGTTVATFEADSGYRFPNDVTVTGANYSWQQGSGNYWDLVLAAPAENVTVTITATLIPTYTLNTAFTNMVVTSGTIPSVVDDEDVVNITFVAAAGYTLPSTINVNGYNVPVNQGTATYGNCIADYSISNDVGTLSLAQFTGNTTASGTATANSFSITVRAQDGSYSGDSTIVTYGTATVTIIPNAHYSLPSSITVINASYTYNSTTGVVSLSYPTGEVGILAICVADSYSITNSITNGSASGASTIIYGGTAIVTISANSGYELPSTVTVSGASYSYNGTTGVITLSNPTGNVTITATCPSSVSYVIKEGLYYGKNGPPPEYTADVPLNFISNGNSYTSLEIRGEDHELYYNNTLVLDYTTWQSNYRTITVTQDTAVTQLEYNWFFACFGGYGGTVQLYSGGADDLYVKINGVCSRSSYDANPYIDELYINVPNGVTVNLYNPMYNTFDNIVAVNCTYQFNTSIHNMVVTPTADNWSFTADGYE